LDKNSIFLLFIALKSDEAILSKNIRKKLAKTDK